MEFYSLLFLVVGIVIGSALTWLYVKSKVSEKGISLEDLKQNYIEKSIHDELKFDIKAINEENKILIGDTERLKTQLSNSRDEYERKKAELKEIEKTFIEKFENISNKVLRNQSETLNRNSNKQLESLLSPFEKTIKEFQSKVEKTHEERLKEAVSLQQQINQLSSMNESLTKEASNLSKALRSDPKKRGSWGEMVLETILEKSGLQKNVHYRREVSGNNDGDNLRADIIVDMPDHKNIIIDSKVTLNTYYDYVQNEEKDRTELLIKSFSAGVRKHIDTLHKKRYDQMYGINSPEYVLMFMPVEPAFFLALEADPELYQYAMDRNVVLVTTSTLLALMSTVATIWQHDKQHQNATKIAEEAGKLQQQVYKFLGELNDLKNHIDGSAEAYENAVKRLTTGNNNVIKLTKKIEDLGATLKASTDDKKEKEKFVSTHNILSA